MLNPREIQKFEIENKNKINVNNLAEIEDTLYYALDDPKEYRKYIINIKNIIRRSIEYKDLVNHVKLNYFNNASGIDGDCGLDVPIKTELHHVPLVLEDIVELVYVKNLNEGKSVDMIDIAIEVLNLHFDGLVGLYNLTETEHEMIHNNTLFIPLQCIYGNVKEFMNLFEEYTTDYQKEVFEYYEKLSEECKDIMNKEYFDIEYYNINMISKDQIQEISKILLDKINNKYSLNKM